MHEMSSTSSSGSEKPSRKRLRKGTHSCLECRRRKVRCVFEPNNQRCRDCVSREAPCTQQTVSSQRKKSSEKDDETQKRIRDLEGALAQVLERLPQKAVPSSVSGSGLGSTTDAFSQPHKPAELADLTPDCTNASSSPTSTGPHAPLLSLFNNLILGRAVDNVDENDPAKYETVARKSDSKLRDKNIEILRFLKDAVPNANDLYLILQCSHDSWKMWYKVFSQDLRADPGRSKHKQVEMLRDYIYRCLNSGDMAVVAKIMLCLTIHIQQLPPDFDYDQTNLRATSKSLQKYYMGSIESLLGPDEGLAGTVDGLECLLIQADFYINAGRPRKVWLIFRRAVSLAFLLGLHNQVDDAEDQEALRKRRLWIDIWQSDRGFSLLFGLPYAVPDAFSPAATVLNDDSGGHSELRFALKLGTVTGHIIDRNQNNKQMPYLSTLGIDQELQECRVLMPCSWWEADPESSMSLEAIYNTFVLKLRYHKVRGLLHLPFMLQSYRDHTYDYSRLSTLEESRDMINAYRVLRDERRAILKMCELADFEVFTAAMVLVINLLGHSRILTYQDPIQDERDWEIVKGLMQEFKRVSRSMVCSVADRAAQLLEDFYNAHHSLSDSWTGTYEATIPWFGRLRIYQNQSPQLQESPSSVPQQQASNVQDSFSGRIEDPLIAFDGYFQSLPSSFQPWPELDTNWMSNLAMDEDWSWFPNAGGNA